MNEALRRALERRWRAARALESAQEIAGALERQLAAAREQVEAAWFAVRLANDALVEIPT